MWVARNKYGTLGLYYKKPIRDESHLEWQPSDKEGNWMLINLNLFPYLRWKDEPIEIGLIDKNKVINSEEKDEFIDYLIWVIHESTSYGDCVYQDCYERLKDRYYKEYKENCIK
jgi:hypothetical protein